VNPKWLEARRGVFRHARPAWETAPVEVDGTEATPEMVKALVAVLEARVQNGEGSLDEVDLLAIKGLEDIKLPLGGLPIEGLVQRMRLPGRGTNSQWTYTLKSSHAVQWTQEFDIKTARLKGPLYVKTDPLPQAQIKSKEDIDADANPDAATDKKRPGLGSPDGPASKKAKPTEKWERRESKSQPGQYYYFNNETGDTSVEVPADYKGPKASDWERLKSKSSGKFYHYNHATGDTQVERPDGVKLRNDEKDEKEAEESGTWERRESASRPGKYYYFNTKTGENDVDPPRVDLPWSCVESKTKRGQFFYNNELTGETRVDPPAVAKSKTLKKKEAEAKKEAAPEGKSAKGNLPANWTKKESDKNPGKFYFVNSKTNETSWKAPSSWERVESGSKPGSYYYKNCESGETSWEKKPTGVQ